MIRQIIIALLSLHFVNGENCFNITSHTTGSRRGFTTIMKGNYTIHALITLSDGEKCDKISRNGVIKSFAIQYAIDQGNKDFLKYGNVGLRLDDICDLKTTMARGIEIIAIHRPNSICRPDFLNCKSGSPIGIDAKRPTAVLGTDTSFTTVPLANLLSMFNITQVSYGATTRVLSTKRDLYKSFFRTVPSDTHQLKVMLDIFVKFKWNYIFAIGSDDDYGRLAVSEMKTLALKKDICITVEYIPNKLKEQVLKEKVIKVVEKMADMKKAQVVVLFCFVKDLGLGILEQAKVKGLQRIWITSEAWNPSAKYEFKESLKEQVDGLLTVSLKGNPLPKLGSYISHQVITNFKCNIWLMNYLENKYKCKPNTIYDNLFKGNNCTIKVFDVISNLSILPGKIDRLIDATSTLFKGIHNIVKRKCENIKGHCNIKTIEPNELTREINDISFENEQGEEISFLHGDLKYAYYTIDNLRWKDGSYEYVKVGSWSEKRKGKELLLREEKIIWPKWMKDNNTKYPESNCSEECVPGEYVTDRKVCCWICTKCKGLLYSDDNMASNCKNCSKYSYPNPERTDCIQIPIFWLDLYSPAGIIVVIASCIGIFSMSIVSVILIKYRRIIMAQEPTPYLLLVSCGLIFATFVYGPFLIAEPSKHLCEGRSAYFYIVLMMFPGICLVKTNVLTQYFRRHADKSFRGQLFYVQSLFLFMLFLLELIVVVTWLYVDKITPVLTPDTNVTKIWSECGLKFTPARLVSTSMPCIVLIIATLCSFRERTMEHLFHEPRFLSFTSICFCVATAAFIPEMKYDLGMHREIFMAFISDIFGFTYMVLMIFPKSYLVLVHHSSAEYQMPPTPEPIAELPRPHIPANITDIPADEIAWSFPTQHNDADYKLNATC